jgi:hypothetical protein
MKIYNKTVKIGLTTTIIALWVIIMFHPTFYPVIFVSGWYAGIVISKIWRDELTKDK